MLQAAGVRDPASAALALLSALAGAALIPLLFALFRRLGDDDAVAWWAMAVAVCSPLFWFTALRPLSDMTGLALRSRLAGAGAVALGPAAGVGRV